MIIAMFYEDHNPPHFHARYGNDQAVIKIDDFMVLEGFLPPRALGLVVEWAARHKAELANNWRLAVTHQPLQKVAPLD
ncbi:MAG: DUF4160 domain-containing protein [Desulfobaccales bacterium]